MLRYLAHPPMPTFAARLLPLLLILILLLLLLLLLLLFVYRDFNKYVTRVVLFCLCYTICHLLVTF